MVHSTPEVTDEVPVGGQCSWSIRRELLFQLEFPGLDVGDFFIGESPQAGQTVIPPMSTAAQTAKGQVAAGSVIDELVEGKGAGADGFFHPPAKVSVLAEAVNRQRLRSG